MDEKTIKAMWAVIEALDEKAADIHRRGLDGLYFVDTTIPKAKFLAGIEGIRSLVDRAAAEQAEPVAAGGEEMLERFTEDLEDAVIAGQKDHETHVSIMTTRCQRTWSLADTSAVIRAINGLLNARPTTAASEDGPTIEECLAAVNRAEYMGGGFKIAAVNEQAGTWISSLGIEGVGRLLIAREKAAKGGAH